MFDQLKSGLLDYMRFFDDISNNDRAKMRYGSHVVGLYNTSTAFLVEPFPGFKKKKWFLVEIKIKQRNITLFMLTMSHFSILFCIN